MIIAYLNVILLQLVPVRCDSCRQNFCLRHRHEQDHNCSAVVRGSGAGRLVIVIYCKYWSQIMIISVMVNPKKYWQHGEAKIHTGTKAQIAGYNSTLPWWDAGLTPAIYVSCGRERWLKPANSLIRLSWSQFGETEKKRSENNIMFQCNKIILEVSWQLFKKNHATSVWMLMEITCLHVSLI